MPSKTYFRMRWADDAVVEVTPIRETPAYVYVPGFTLDGPAGEQREKKKGSYFDTKAEAIQYWVGQVKTLMAECEEELKGAQIRLDYTKHRLANLERRMS